jgi:hypothetical protein
VLDSLWSVFREKELDLYSEHNEELLTSMLKIVNKMLETETYTVFSSLKEIGLGVRLDFLLKRNFNPKHPLTLLLVNIMQHYLEQEVSFYKNS